MKRRLVIGVWWLGPSSGTDVGEYVPDRSSDGV